MKALSLAAAAIILATITSASAAPTAVSKSQLATSSVSSIVQIQHRRHAAPPHAQHRRYVPGRRYGSAPRGWHRHGARPGDWQRRGCVMVGPVWFCP